MIRSILLLSVIAVAATGCGKKAAAGTEGDPSKGADPAGGSISNDRLEAAKDTNYTKMALSFKKHYQGNIKKVAPGSRADFMQAIGVVGGTFGHKFNDDGITKYQLAITIDLPFWVKVFGQSEKLSDRYDTFSRREYQRWKHTCTDGPITFHGNIILPVQDPQRKGVLQCTSLCLY